jgi:uncharacterized membrane protein YvbJ
MWICPACGSRNPSSERRCSTCGRKQPKAVNFKERNLERRLTPEELAELRRMYRRRRLVVLGVFLLLVLVVCAYLFAVAELLGLPRPDSWPTFFANSARLLMP